MAIYPAIDIRSGPADIIPAIVDDFHPTAIEERADAMRVFFVDTNLRDAAGAALSAAKYNVRRVDVDDEDWARRSQENLKPVTVGRITVAPPWCSQPQPLAPNPQPLSVVIQPSMGFGTGHHATTRLCLRGLQTVELNDQFMLDVGTGSGVLAIAAVRLGAARALGVDYDADAIHAANENLPLNPGVDSVEFRVADLSTADLPEADVVTANLTGAVLIRSAARLLDLLRPGGVLIVSGLLDEERDDVVRAFARFAGPDKVRPTTAPITAGSKRTRPTGEDVGRVLPPPLAGPVRELRRDSPKRRRREGGSDPPIVWEQSEDGWVALAMKRS